MIAAIQIFPVITEGAPLFLLRQWNEPLFPGVVRHTPRGLAGSGTHGINTPLARAGSGPSAVRTASRLGRPPGGGVWVDGALRGGHGVRSAVEGGDGLGEGAGPFGGGDLLPLVVRLPLLRKQRLVLLLDAARQATGGLGRRSKQGFVNGQMKLTVNLEKCSETGKSTTSERMKETTRHSIASSADLTTYIPHCFV